MSIHVDQDNERERRSLRKVNVLFLKRLELERRRAERNRRAREAYNAEVSTCEHARIG